MPEKTACNNNKCIKFMNCKRYKLFLMGNSDVATNSGNAERPCKKYIPLNNKIN